MAGGKSDGMIDVEIEGLTGRLKSSRRKARQEFQHRSGHSPCSPVVVWFRLEHLLVIEVDRSPCNNGLQVREPLLILILNPLGDAVGEFEFTARSRIF